ncbi:Bicoid-interacting protein 3, partial [Opisthorchis viverrini]
RNVPSHTYKYCSKRHDTTEISLLNFENHAKYFPVFEFPTLLFRTRELVCAGRISTHTFSAWPRGPRPLLPRGIPPPSLPSSRFCPLSANQLALVSNTSRQNLRTSWKTCRSTVRPRFQPRRRFRNFTKSKITLNPSDPLNLQDLMKETERRRSEGLSPLRGDSRLNTPALSMAGDAGNESPQVALLPAGPDARSSQDSMMLKQITKPRISANRARPPRGVQRYSSRRQRCRKVPVTGNYGDYYSRRDPNDRLPYLMPEWFTGKDIADYGCHNGTLTFGILERFPDVRHIDAIDCDAELIANAKSMQRERLRWDTGSGIRYDKINFQVANWIDSSTPTEEPEYDTILAFSVTKWIHLNHGDAGLMRFFRRAFNLLKPGGHLILEPQPKSSYRRTRFTFKHRSTFQTLKIDPLKLEPLLVDLGFSYFDTIKLPRPNEPFRRKIILCSKSYGATPASIRNDFRSEVQLWNLSPSPQSLPGREPPPVCYHPQTPNYLVTDTPARLLDSPASGLTQRAYVVPSTTSVPSSRLRVTSPDRRSVSSVSDAPCEPDSTSVP